MSSASLPVAIGRYQIKEEIGRGGMGIVYRAYDERFDRDVALKILSPEYGGSDSSRSRFDREAKLVAGLEHPAIVPVYDYGEEAGRPYFVMRLMLGGTLADRIQGMPLEPREAVDLVEQLAPGLDLAHARGVIHRDLKPGNILFDLQSKPYLSDFGIATTLRLGGSESISQGLGTPTYMSPEQIDGQTLDGRSDLYALAVVLWESLTGTTPYGGDQPLEMAIQHLRAPLPSIRTLRPELPPAFEEVMARALAKSPGARYGSAAALAEAMRDALATYRPPPRSYASPPRLGEGRPPTPAGPRIAQRGARRVATPARTTPRPATPRPQTPRPVTPPPRPAPKARPGPAVPSIVAPRPSAAARRPSRRPPVARALRDYLPVLLFGGAALLVALLFLLAQ